MIDICEQVAESLAAFLDEEHASSPAGVGLDRASIDAHLRVCEYCRARPTSSARSTPRPHERVWAGIEAVLRSDGLIRD